MNGCFSGLASGEKMCQRPRPNPNPNSSPSPNREEVLRDLKKQVLLHELSRKLSHGDLGARVQAARDIRKLARASAKSRSVFAVGAVVGPLVSMLRYPEREAKEAALFALLNLAVRNEQNKVTIVKSGAIPSLVELLKSESSSMRELAAATLLTLSASEVNKPTIAASGAASPLVRILISGSIQGKVDAVTTLYNLSTCKENLNPSLYVEAVPSLLTLLKECKKYSKFAEKASTLLQILSDIEEGRSAIAEFDGGILTLVETVEDGSLLSMEYAVGGLLSLCRSNRKKYRELILKEGAIPGLLRLTVYGTKKAQERAQNLLVLLRDDSRPKRVASEVLETIVYDIAARVDGPSKAAETAKKLLKDMARRNTELSISHLRLRDASYTPTMHLK